jgi:hypothetical protein
MQELIQKNNKDFFLSFFINLPTEKLLLLEKGAYLLLHLIIKIYCSNPKKISGDSLELTYPLLEKLLKSNRQQIRRYFKNLEDLEILYRRHKITAEEVRGKLSVRIIKQYQYSNNNMENI